MCKVTFRSDGSYTSQCVNQNGDGFFNVNGGASVAADDTVTLDADTSARMGVNKDIIISSYEETQVGEYGFEVFVRMKEEF